MRRVGCACLWFVLVAGCGCTTSTRVAGPPAPTRHEEFPALVLIETTDPEWAAPKTAAGYFVPPDLVVTARHCLIGGGREGYVNFGAGGVRAIEGVRDYGDDADLAVLKIESLDANSLSPAAAARDPVPGEPVRLITRNPDGTVRSRSSGFVKYVTSAGGWRRAVLSTPTVPGFSGGLVLNAHGGVIAIISGGTFDETDAPVLDNSLLRSIQGVGKFLPLSEWIDGEGRPDFGRALRAFQRAAGEQALGNRDRAIELLEKAVDLDPQYCAFQGQLVESLWDAGRTEEAQRRLDDWAAQGGCEPSVELERGSIAFRRGDYEAAARSFRASIALRPTTEAYIHLVAALLKGGDDTGAAEAIEAARRFSPDDPSILQQQVLAHLRDRAPVLALPLIEELGRVDFSERSFWLQGMVLSSAGQRETALSAVQEGAKRYPRSGELQALISFVLCSMGRFDEATAAARRATDLDPRSSNAWRQLGICRQAEGHCTSAADAYERAFAIDRSPDTLAFIVRACRKAGDNDRAEKWLKELDSLNPYMAQRLRRQSEDPD